MTRRCIASVTRALSVAKNSEHQLILVDNGSTLDNSKQISKDLPLNTQILRIEPNAGFANGMNGGLHAAFSNNMVDLVTTLSNDTELPENYFQSMPLHTEEATIFCPIIHYLSDRKKISYTHGQVEMSQDPRLSHHIDLQIRELTFPNYYPAAAMLWNRRAFEQTQGFNERFFCYWEDVELSYRCQHLGVKLISSPSLYVHHLGRGTTGGKRAYSTHFIEGKKLFLEILSKEA